MPLPHVCLFIHSLQFFTLGCSTHYITHLREKWTLVYSCLKPLNCQIVNLQPCCSEAQPQPNACICILFSVSPTLLSLSLALFFSLLSPHFTCLLPIFSLSLPSSLSLSLPLPLPCHYHSLVPWPGLVFTVLVLIRRLPLGWGPACVWSNGTEICSHFSSHPWQDFLQNVWC